MTQRYILSSLLISAASLLSPIAADASAVRFMPESDMASGKWVKVGVDCTGVFEISYATLRSMGFSDPQRVAVLGRGGKQFNMNFTDETGYPIYSDRLPEVAVIHKGEKLYFYAEGPDEFTINRKAADVSGGYFKHTNRNIYSSMGYYFLTDSCEPAMMTSVDVGNNPDALIPLSNGFGMVSHQLDLRQNSTDTGQLFYGEAISGADSRLTWQVELPDAIAGAPGAMECLYYLDHVIPGTWSYGIEEDKSTAADMYSFKDVASSAIRSIYPTYLPLTIPGNTATVFVNVNIGEVPVIGNLDYWTLTYSRTLPSLRSPGGQRMNQDFIAFPNALSGADCSLRLPGGAGFMAFDVTDPAQPLNMTVTPAGADGLVRLNCANAHSNPPQVVVFDPLMPQHQIKGVETGYTAIANQDLHRCAAEGADLVIICIPQLYDVARRIAMLHEEHDAIKVLVATSEECYNEFSAGLPDPMAYRALVKAIYTSPLPCRNLLLLGPLYSDFRGVVNDKQPHEGLIAYQSSILMEEKGAPNANDVLGMMGDYIDLSQIYSNEMQVGVGILPVRYPAEADIIVEKIERYLKAENLPYYLNLFTHVGGIGNSHTHELQAVQQSHLTDRLSDYSVISSTVPVDAYGFIPAQERLFHDLDQGRLMMVYYGHGSGKMLNQEGDFFTAADVYRLRNKYLPFMGFAGCSLSDTDRGNRGLGESIVLSTRYGAIGSLIATRETWSGENGLLFESLYTNHFRDGAKSTSPVHSTQLTIGEVVARTKSQNNNNNELTYLLICDPALKIPAPIRRVFFQSEAPLLPAAGRVKIKGYVGGPAGSGEIDGLFNGTAVVRLMQPSYTYISPDICTGDDAELRVPVNDQLLSMGTTEVQDGQFEIDLIVPAAAADFEGLTGRIHVCVYNPTERIAGGGQISGTYAPASQNSSIAADKYPPVIEHFSFDPELKELTVRVSDDVALSYSTDALNPSFRLLIDGREFPAALHAPAITEPDCEAYTRNIPIPDITEGDHTATLTVCDAAGNRASAQTTFSFRPTIPWYALTLRSKAVTSLATFDVVGMLPDEADIVVLSPEGTEVARIAIDGRTTEWTPADSYGNPLAPGLYKAYLIETGNGSRKGHSALIDLPVTGQ